MNRAKGFKGKQLDRESPPIEEGDETMTIMGDGVDVKDYFMSGEHNILIRESSKCVTSYYKRHYKKLLEGGDLGPKWRPNGSIN